jgi:hypothetical protein
MSEYDINQKVAEEICAKYRLNGREFKLGEGVALLDGKVVAVEKNLDAAVQALVALGGNAQRGMVFEVGPLVDYIR